jgi:hypothetical protein
MCAECNYAPECYACMVGVATGPESHSPCCPLSRRRVEPTPVTHRIHTREDGMRSTWECSCGRGGSASTYRVDWHSDKHINRARGDRRIDTSRPF